MRIAVTGANGFVGTELCKHLCQQGLIVRAISRHTSNSSNNKQPNLEPAQLNSFEQIQPLSNALHNCQVLIHLVAKTHYTGNSNALAGDYQRINIQYSLNAAEAAARAGVKRFIFLSSIKVNGESTKEAAFTHSSPVNPADNYGISKHQAELALQSRCHQIGLELTIVRPPLLYGNDVKGNLATLQKAIRYRVPLPFGSLQNRRSLLSLTNLCNLLHICCLHPAANGQTFLAADKQPLSTRQISEQLGRELKITPLIYPCPRRILHTLGKLTGREAAITRLTGNLEINIDHTLQTLGWQPS